MSSSRTQIMATTKKLLATGRNSSGIFGIDTATNLKELVCLNDNESHKDKLIANVLCGDRIAIYVNENNQNIWSSGKNANGQCAISITHKNDISTLSEINFVKSQIHKICVNVIELISCLLWILTIVMAVLIAIIICFVCRYWLSTEENKYSVHQHSIASLEDQSFIADINKPVALSMELEIEDNAV